MGEAKIRAQLQAAKFKYSCEIKRARFNVYAIGTRQSFLYGRVHEVSWWSSLDERLLGVVAFDYTDRDYNAMILARDLRGCFRCVDVQTDFKSQRLAEDAVRARIGEFVEGGEIEELGRQGDETNVTLDLFELPTDMDPEKLHPYFRLLLEDPGRAPARAVIKEIGTWLAPEDPHLAKEFQTKGFDQRLWEIYLWAAFKEFALDVEHLSAPDFRCSGRGQDFTVEATTVAPSLGGVLAEHPKPETQDEMQEFLRNYMPMKFGSALTSKLNKRNKAGEAYWEMEGAKDKPFCLAIADFHAPADKDSLGSMTYTQSALFTYLYGHRVGWEIVDDQVVIKEESVDTHSYREKTIPSGFFDQAGAENVSAVIFSNAGTLAKFDRIGVAAGFAAPDHRYYRIGLKPNPDPDATVGVSFSQDLLEPDYEEFWTQEVQVFHNPNASRPLSFEALPGATHHFFDEGKVMSLAPDDAILSSRTLVLKIRKDGEEVEI